MQAMNNRQTQVGSCVYCGRKCHQQCERCLDHYCSVQCQQHDWQRHRYVCFPMPRLITYGSLHNNDYSIPPLSGSMKDMNISDSTSSNNNDYGRSTASNQNRSQRSEKSEGFKKPASTTVVLKGGNQVYLMGFRSTNRCYVRPYSVEADAEYKKMMEKINEYGKNAPRMETLPNREELAIAQWNGVYGRVRILKNSREHNNVLADFIDFGDKQLCALATLRVISDELIALPVQLCPISLSNTRFVTNVDQINKTLSEFLDRPYILRYTDRDNQFVELIYPNSGQSLNEKLNKVLLGLNSNNKPSSSAPQAKSDEAFPTAARISPKKRDSDVNLNGPNPSQQAGKTEVLPTVDTNKEKKSPQPANTPEINRNETLKPKTDTLKAPFKLVQWLPTTESIEVMIVDNSGLEDGFIGCIQATDGPKISGVLQYLADYQPEEKPYRPICGEYVLAKFEGGWYRARVMDIDADADAFLVYYVDFTNESTVSADDIRAYPRDGDSALYTNCYSVLCSLEGLRGVGTELSLNEKQVALLKGGVLADSARLIIDEVKEQIEEITVIKCGSVMKELKKLEK